MSRRLRQSVNLVDHDGATRPLDDVVFDAILGALERHFWNIQAAATALGITRPTIYAHLRARDYELPEIRKGKRS